MSGITVKFRKDTSKKLDKAVQTALEQTAKAVLIDVRDEQVMPMDKGVLQFQSTYVYDAESEQGVVAIISDTPYARRLYYHPEYDFSTSENANAGGKWFKPWMDGDKADFAANKFAELLKRNMK